MAEDLTYNINLRVSDSQLKSLQELLGKTNEELGYTDKGLNKVEKQLAQTGKQARSTAQQVGTLNKTLTTSGGTTKNLSTQAAAAESAFNGLANTRYALYDVATTLTAVSAATLGLSAAAIKVEADFEQLLVQVQRTAGVSGAEWETLRESIIGLSTEIPASLQDLAEIATLAGQLGIAAENIDSFTESVVKFSATTDVTASQAAESIGRTAQLAGVGADEYENLAASIYQVGITSVSTESDILSVSQQIAVSARQAGFAAEETVALASALASLGVAPERARGSIQRVFNIITNAVDNGSEELQTFARYSGETADQFAKQWKDDAQGAFLAFLQGLGQANDSGENLNNILESVGISAVRDTDALKRLAQNTEVYTQAIDEASQGWNDGSQFAEGYALVAETLNSKLQVLGQTLLAVIEAGQDNTVLKQFVDYLQAIAEVALRISQSGVGQVITPLVIAFGALVGAIALAGAAAAAGTAALYAMITALRSFSAESKIGQTNTGLFSLALKEFILTSKGASAAQREAAASVGVFSLAMRRSAVSTDVAKTAVAGLGLGVKALKATIATTGIGLAFIAIGEAASFFINQSDEMESTIDELSSSFEELTGAVTGATREIVYNQLVTSGAVESAKALGIPLDDLVSAVLGEADALASVNAILDENAKATDKGAAGIRNQAEAAAQASSDNAVVSRSIDDLTDLLGKASDAWQDKTTATQDSVDASLDAAYATEEEVSATNDLIDSLFSVTDLAVASANAMYSLGESLAANGYNFDILTAAGRENYDTLAQTVNALYAQYGDSPLFTAAIQQMYDMLIAGGAAANQISFLNQIIATGAIPSTSDLASVAADLVPAFNEGFNAGTTGATQTAAATKSAQKEVRTLSDYVSDLGKVMSDAFDFRFGFGQSRDATSSVIQDIADSFEDARQKIRDARLEIQSIKAEIKGLRSDRNILEYQLKVATEYGDTLRANEIQAELAANAADLKKAQADLKDTQDELTDAQAYNSKTLVGNSEAARDNRANVLDLISAYQEQIEQYAATGASQAQVQRYAANLKTEFQRQAQQLGYSRSQLRQYSAAFDDFAKIAREVPRNLTVNVNAKTSAAEKALAEYRSSIDKTNKSINGLRNNSNRNLGSFGNGMSARDVRREALEAQIEAYSTLLNSPKTSDNGKRALFADLTTLREKLRLGNYYTGGYTGNGGKYEPAGTVHKGEYVIESERVRKLGVPFLNALGRSTERGYANGGPVNVTASVPGAMMVELSPTDRRLLAAAGNVTLTANGRVLANVVNGVNKATNSAGA